MQIRPADTDDYAGIETVLKSAFPDPSEAQLVVSLRAADADTLELVAEKKGVVCGTLMFSPVTAKGETGTETYGLGLGPLAVSPDQQNQGIGAALVDAGLDYIKTLGAPFCVVLGDPDYYVRFGFETAAKLGIYWDKDEDGQFAKAFQILVFNPAALPVQKTVIHYHAAFDTV